MAIADSARRPDLRHAYIALVVATGFVVIGRSIAEVITDPPGLEWLVLAALTLFTGSFTVKLPSLSARISVSETFVFTSVLLFGPATGTLTVVLDVLVISFWRDSQKRHLLRLLFNVTAASIAIRGASDVFFRLSGAHPGAISRTDIAPLIIPVFAFALLYFLINTILVTGAIAAERGESFVTIWIRHFPGVSINYFVGSSIAMLIVAYTDRLNVSVLGIILPLLLISYLTFRTSMGRLEDANRHVAQIQELYLSAIEALAMAVDAKDQITHGHIRRVQVYAVELAKRLGVREPNQLRAIETAALLHDMGKIAIPEHILNKPGRLTTVEFEKMKRHAQIGADLLSSIRFPYPVVPVVRHHHENWDGTGYPTGVAGTDIPLGARILSVVDCFDALTSDRPYRPRLTKEAAFAILQDRKGSMYDPLVVDAFLEAFGDIAPLAAVAGQQARSIVPSFTTEATDTLSEIRSNAVHTSLFEQLAHKLSDSRSAADAITTVGQYVRILMPASVCALYQFVNDTDSLVCVGAAGDSERLLDTLIVKRGERITGWVAAHLCSSVNSEARLDLGTMVELFNPPLRSAMITPVVRESRLIGVLAVYSPRETPFTEDDRYTLERIASQLATMATVVGQPSSTIVRFRSSEKR